MTLMPHVMCYVLCIFLPIVSYVAYHQAMHELDKRNTQQMFHVKHSAERDEERVAGGGERGAAIAAYDERVAANGANSAGGAARAESEESAAGSAFTSKLKPVYDDEPISTVIRILAGIALLGFAVGLAGAYPFHHAVVLTLPLRIVHQIGVCVLSCGLIWLSLIHISEPTRQVR